MKCEHTDKACYMPNMKICDEHSEYCKRRKLLTKGMTNKEIDDLWNVPEKYRVKENEIT